MLIKSGPADEAARNNGRIFPVPQAAVSIETAVASSKMYGGTQGSLRPEGIFCSPFNGPVGTIILSSLHFFCFGLLRRRFRMRGAVHGAVLGNVVQEAVYGILQKVLCEVLVRSSRHLWE